MDCFNDLVFYNIMQSIGNAIDYFKYSSLSPKKKRKRKWGKLSKTPKCPHFAKRKKQKAKQPLGR